HYLVRQRIRDAAIPSENTALHTGRPGCRVPRIFPVSVVQHVEDFGPELQLKALRQAEIFQQARIQIPEVRSLHDVASITLLSWRRDAEKRLRAGDVDAVVVWIRRVGNELPDIVHHRALHPAHELYVALV